MKGGFHVPDDLPTDEAGEDENGEMAERRGRGGVANADEDQAGDGEQDRVMPLESDAP